MTSVLCAGVAVVDLVLEVDGIASQDRERNAHSASIVGGGCAANAAVAIARLGGTAHLISRLGADPIGDIIVADLEAEDVDCTLVHRYGACKSSYSSVLIDPSGERQIMNYRDVSLPNTPHWSVASLPPIDAILVDTRWPDGGTRLLTQSDGKPTVVDAEAPISGAEELIEHGSHIAFSVQGLRDFLASKQLPFTTIEAGLKEVDRYAAGIVMATDGADGVFWREDGVAKHLPAFKVAVVDTLGAGDVWHGAFALALGENAAVNEAVRFANAAAALKCTQFGGRKGSPSREEITAFLEHRAAN